MSIAPVRREIVVEAPQRRAFEVFTAGMNRWWPREHHIGKSPLKEIIVEPRVGGRWYSVCEDGSQCDVGKVLAWDPPGRLLLAWQITGEWQFDPAFVTDVEITFTAEGPTRTRVVLEHRDLERFGKKAGEIRGMIGAEGGWPKVLSEFARVAAG